ncbi:MAG: hypothetical protein V1702_00835 [Candidatus Woesearchaeota archaeon]
MTNYSLELIDGMMLRDNIVGKQKRKGFHHFIKKIEQGQDYYKDDEQFHNLSRVIDKSVTPTHYYEHITDKTGNTIRHVDCPLTEHQDLDSAKKKVK